MKIRNLLVLAIAIAAATLSAQAQKRDEPMTFADHLGQSITISRFGTVLRFKDSKGRKSPTENYFRIGPYGNNGPFPWIDSRKGAGTKASLKANFPRGATLEEGQRLDVTATIRQGPWTVERQLTWSAGSSLVNLDEIISGADVVGTLDEGVLGVLTFRPPCPPLGKCPPEGESAFRLTSKQLSISPGKPDAIIVIAELTRQLPISPGQPMRVLFTMELSAIPPISPSHPTPPISQGKPPKRTPLYYAKAPKELMLD